MLALVGGVPHSDHSVVYFPWPIPVFRPCAHECTPVELLPDSVMEVQQQGRDLCSQFCGINTSNVSRRKIRHANIFVLAYVSPCKFIIVTGLIVTSEISFHIFADFRRKTVNESVKVS